MYKDMLYIKKGKLPKSFIEYTREKCARFDDMPSETKKELRRSLLEEQGYLCAYCMRRIADGGAETKIEHLQARNLSNELVYPQLEKKLRFYEGGEQGKKVPYCGIIVWYLRKRLGLWKR